MIIPADFLAQTSPAFRHLARLWADQQDLQQAQRQADDHQRRGHRRRGLGTRPQRERRVLAKWKGKHSGPKTTTLIHKEVFGQARDS